MNDEQHVFRQDVREKKIISHGAFKRRRHAGKGGAVRFPTDNLTKKELRALSGEVKAYRLNDPMTWKEFRQMPDDLQETYIKLLHSKFNVPDCRIAEMMGVTKTAFSNVTKQLGINPGRNGKRPKKNWKQAEFEAWVAGEKPEPESNEPELVCASLKEIAPIQPAIESIPVCKDTITPYGGSLDFKGTAEEIFRTVAALVGTNRLKMSVTWTVMQNDGE